MPSSILCISCIMSNARSYIQSQQALFCNVLKNDIGHTFSVAFVSASAVRHIFFTPINIQGVALQTCTGTHVCLQTKGPLLFSEFNRNTSSQSSRNAGQLKISIKPIQPYSSCYDADGGADSNRSCHINDAWARKFVYANSFFAQYVVFQEGVYCSNKCYVVPPQYEIRVHCLLKLEGYLHSLNAAFVLRPIAFLKK